MIFQRILRAGPARAAGQRLYGAIVARARSPRLYAELGAPDTPDGRFEIYSLHLLMMLERMKGQGGPAAAVAQALFDAYISGLDHGLRELAVGDLSVGKTMRKLGEAFYGRGKALDAAIGRLPDRGPLEALIARTVLGGAEGADPAPLTAYFLALREELRALPLERLMAGEVGEGAAA